MVDVSSGFKKCYWSNLTTSNSAAGQQRELNFALNKRTKFKSRKIMALTLPGVEFNQLSEKLSKYTGRRLDINNIQSIAYKIAKTVFPNIVKKSINEPWKYPVPGDWLQVSDIDEFIGNQVALGDKLYFRTLSPMGLFECYSPKLKKAVLDCTRKRQHFS